MASKKFKLDDTDELKNNSPSVRRQALAALAECHKMEQRREAEGWVWVTKAGGVRVQIKPPKKGKK